VTARLVAVPALALAVLAVSARADDLPPSARAADVEDWRPRIVAEPALPEADLDLLRAPDDVAGGPAPEVPSSVRGRVVAAARRRLGRPFAGDCSGFVLGAMGAAGIRPALAPARSRSESLFRATYTVSAPEPGDLAFFHDTYDRNRDGRVNDPFTHVALVEAVEDDVVVLLHRGVGGVERIRMDLGHPSDPDTNDRVRMPRGDDPPTSKVLAGELFAGYGALPRARVRPGPRRGARVVGP
jgi:hypothetical protein